MFTDAENDQRVISLVCISCPDDGDGGINGCIFINGDVWVGGEEDRRVIVDVGDVYIDVKDAGPFWISTILCQNLSMFFHS